MPELDPAVHVFAMACLFFDQDEAPSATARSESCRTRSGKRVEHDVTGARVCVDERQQRRDGLFRGMAVSSSAISSGS